MRKRPNQSVIWTVSTELTQRISNTRHWILAFVFSISLAPEVHADRLIGASKYLGHIADINPATGVVSKQVKLTEIPCAPDYDFTSLAKHPGTGVIYGILKGNPSILVTVDKATCVVTTVADTGTEGAIGWISTITFGAAPTYPLYAIVGGDSDGGTPGSIHILDKTTGQPTATGWTTSGVSAHAIEFNPDDEPKVEGREQGPTGGPILCQPRATPATPWGPRGAVNKPQRGGPMRPAQPSAFAISAAPDTESANSPPFHWELDHFTARSIHATAVSDAISISSTAVNLKRFDTFRLLAFLDHFTACSIQ